MNRATQPEALNRAQIAYSAPRGEARDATVVLSRSGAAG